MNWESDSLKALAQRAAAFSASPDNLSTLRSLYLTGLFEQERHKNAPDDEDVAVDTTKVGIWQKDANGFDFLRRADRRREWGDWADQATIGQKRKWRVALIGESVARGYFYDPDYTPASVLADKLSHLFGSSTVDVVDLAKSNLSIYEIDRLARQSVALEPDVVVIYAGNNWRNQLEQKDIPFAHALLKDGGTPALADFLNAKTRERAARLIESVNAVFSRLDIPIIWVVPEFNIEDWTDPPSNAPMLLAGRNTEWSRLKHRLDLAVSQREWVAAHRLAEKMLQLDGGTNATAPRALALTAKIRGDLASERRYLELCRDSEAWNPAFAYSPRATSWVQAAIRSIQENAKVRVVDIPELLTSKSEGGLPNRRMFLDYCHMTSEAIDLSMSAIAAEVACLINGGKVDTLPSLAAGKSVDSKTEGRASLLAAVHNAHFYQGYEVIRYWCRRALTQWPEAAQIMHQLVDFQSRRVPIMACKSALDLFALNEPVTMKYLMRSSQQRLDLVLSQAIADSLKEVGVYIDDEIARIRLEEHSVASGPRELTSFYYLSGIPSCMEPRWTSGSFPNNKGSRAMFVTAFWPATKFIFFSDCEDVSLKFTYRVPGATSATGVLLLKVNGTQTRQVVVDGEWRTMIVSIPKAILRVGINEAILEWPNGDEDGGHALEDASEMLLRRRLPGFYRVFGQLHDSWAFTGAEKCNEAAKTCFLEIDAS